MKKKIIISVSVIVAIAIAAAIVLVFVLPRKSTHTHDYGTTWEKSATHHWHECKESGECDAKIKDKAVHVDAKNDGKCDICGYIMSSSQTIAVESITLNKTELTLSVNDNDTLSVTYNPTNATNKSVTWSTSAPTVASVDNAGKVTALAAGTATITAETANGKTAECQVTVEAVTQTVAVESISLNKTELTLIVNNSETLSVTYNPTNATNKSVTWSTNAPNIASVNSSGKVTAWAAGTATITAETSNGKTAECKVTVEAAMIMVESITLNKTELTLIVNDSETLSVTHNPTNATDKFVAWRSSSPTVASVDDTGKVTALAAGTATITAETSNRKTAVCQVTVKAATIAVESITLNKTAMTLSVNDSETLNVTYDPTNATDKSVTWSTSAPTVASVNSEGKVTALAAGTATITAETSNGKIATCQVTVESVMVAVESITIKYDHTLCVGDSKTLSVTYTPANATDKSVTWSSDMPTVASINDSGKVTALATGTAYITVQTSNGKVAYCKITVETATADLIYGIEGDTAYVSGVETWSSKVYFVIAPEYDGKPVTAIGKDAFKSKSSLKTVIVPSSVTSIGDSAFYGCSVLSKLNIPDGVTSIGSKAFSGCTILSDIDIPDSVEIVGADAFDKTGWYDKQPNGLVYVGKAAYKYKGGMYSDTSITILDGTKSISGSAFSNCSGLKSITIPDSVTNIGESAFNHCSGLTSITIPDSVTSIGSSAFSDCSGLTSITLSESITSIGNSLFSGCTGLTSIAIPDSVTSIGSSAFEGCSGFTSITIPDGVTSIGSGAFKRCGKLTSITIPDGVTSIEESVFDGCYRLTSITIPDSVTSIGYCAFDGCSGLTSITIPDSVTNIGREAFSSCSGFTSITIPDSVTRIGMGAFKSCTGLKSITIPDSVTVIESSTFNYCIGLTSITIPDSVTTIERSAFSICTGLTSITIPDSVTSIGYEVFRGCSGLTSITVDSGNTKYYSAGNCVIETATKSLIIGCKTSVIPDDVTSIGSDAFSGCSGLTSITIPDGVTSIGSNAFYGCSGLTSITIPVSVTSIGYSAFYECSELTSITFNGTKSQWSNNVSKKTNWDYGTGAYVVTCTNGTVSKSN